MAPDFVQRLKASA